MTRRCDRKIFVYANQIIILDNDQIVSVDQVDMPKIRD